MSENNLMLTTTETATFLGVSTATIYRMEKQGLIKPTKTPGGQRRFSKVELQNYLNLSKDITAPQNPSFFKETKLKQINITGNNENIEIHNDKSTTIDYENEKTDPRNKLNDLTGREWIAETKSVWFQKGLGSSHPHAKIEREHPAPFSYQDIIRLIQFFTKKDNRVLDPFVGVGSTLKACALTNRIGTGIELIEKWAELAKKRLETEIESNEYSNMQQIIIGDARKVLNEIPDEYFDFIVTSPPYWNILNKKPDHKIKKERIANGVATNYSNNENDLGNILDYNEFINELTKIFCTCYKLLKPSKYLCIVVGDFRHKSRYYPFHSDLINKLVNEGHFELSGINILIQNHKQLYPYGYPFSYVPNMHHQFILIFRRRGL